MIKVQVYNDCKEKHESFEAMLRGFDDFMCGYGKDETEAVGNLKEIVEAKIKTLQSIDWDNFDWINRDGTIKLK